MRAAHSKSRSSSGAVPPGVTAGPLPAPEPRPASTSTAAPGAVAEPSSPLPSPAEVAPIAWAETVAQLRPALDIALDQAQAEILDLLRSTSRLSPTATALQRFLSKRGKLVRPLLCAGSYAVFGPQPGQVPPPAVLKVAAGLEIFHAFSLIHDDLIDNSDRRRGQPSLHKLLEEHSRRPAGARHLAMLVGNILFAWSLGTLASSDLPSAAQRAALAHFVQLAIDTGLGEATELRACEAPLATVSEEEILRGIYLKTTRYTVEGPLSLGALLAEAPAPVIATLQRFAEPLGTAFQVENDLHELAPAGRINAAALAWDLQAGVKTLPLRRLFERLDPNQRAWLESLLNGQPLIDGDYHRLSSLLRETGVLADLRAGIERLLVEGFSRLECSPLTASQREGVRQLMLLFQSRLHHSEAKAPTFAASPAMLPPAIPPSAERSS